jgi:hypothetical protein
LQRRDYLENIPSSVAYSTDYVELGLISETLNVIRLLNSSEAFKYFGFKKKQRAYICPTCAHNCIDGELEPKTAILTPNTATSTQVYCFICDKNYIVTRQQCRHNGCKGNVLDTKHNVCLTCNNEYER